MAYKKILETIPLIQSSSLLGENMKLYKKKNKTSKDFIESGIKNIVGVKLIGETSNIIGSI